MRNEIIDCAQMISNTFSGIEKSTLERNNKFYSSWKTVVTKISRTGDKEFGQKLYDHSSIVDVKNGTLLVETDHPAWSQMMQFYTKFILKGLKIYIPEMEIDSIAFRIKGSNATIVEVDYDKQLEKENRINDEKMKKEEEILKKYDKKDEKNNTEKQELPENLKSIFESMKKSMLTKDKNN